MYNLKTLRKQYKTIFLGIFCFTLLFFFNGLYTKAATNSQTLNSTETSTKVKNGFITSKNGDVYYYKKGKKLSGWQVIDGKTYYFDKSQKKKMVTGWQTILFKKYYFKSNGQMVTGKRKIGKYTYYFHKKGYMQTGFQTIKGNLYYFNSKGRMLTGFRTIKKKQYYFHDTGIMQKGFLTLSGKKYYFNSKGIMQTGFTKVGSKTYYFDDEGIMKKGLRKISKKYYYFNDKGVMQVGFCTINNVTYYFDPSTGAMYKPKADGTIKKIGNQYASFNKDGSYVLTASYCIVNGFKVHPQYYTDPKVSEETLLAAILYSEAGNQKDYPVTGKLNNKDVTFYKGHLGVGYVILNRMHSNLGLKEVIYQQYQFEPARTGVLTRYLEHPELVSTDCKNAAKVLLYDYKNKKDSVPDFKRKNFTWKNFWAVTYAKTTNFFEIYNAPEYEIIQGHVFFNYTKKIN